MSLLHQRKTDKHEKGQIFIVLAILIPILIVFVGLSVDLGMAYLTKTTLSKAVDAAALAAMRNINQGQSKAAAVATSAFNANYQSVLGFSGNTPTPTVAWSTDANGNTLVTISATATLNTSFIRVLSILPGVGSTYNTLSISESAQAIRNPLVMSLILDRSGSMNNNGGAAALPGAVTTFISYFDQTVDNAAEISFSGADTVDFKMNTSFIQPITNAVEGLTYSGGTFAQGGLQDGEAQILTKPLTPNIIRVAVFFTDGYANTNNDNLQCNPPSLKTTNRNYGGCAPIEFGTVFFMNPATGDWNGNNCNAKTFPVQAPGVGNSMNVTNITNDATYRTEQLATKMRTNDKITIYSIGLGNLIIKPYLQDIANDPAAATYDATQPVGQAVFAPDASQLQTVFQIIASKILLRLSQ